MIKKFIFKAPKIIQNTNDTLRKATRPRQYLEENGNDNVT